MFERELEREEKTLAAERGRSPSDAASVFGGPAEPPPKPPPWSSPRLLPLSLKPVCPSPRRQAPDRPRPTLCKRRN